MDNTATEEFENALKQAGLESAGDSLFPLHKKEGSFVVGMLSGPRPIQFTARGQKVNKDGYDMVIHMTNVEGYVQGDKVVISPAGLLNKQLTKDKPAHVTLPAVVGITYTGKDDKGFQKTKVGWPKA